MKCGMENVAPTQCGTPVVRCKARMMAMRLRLGKLLLRRDADVTEAKASGERDGAADAVGTRGQKRRCGNANAGATRLKEHGREHRRCQRILRQSESVRG